jgi:uncharacterized membrane protein
MKNQYLKAAITVGVCFAIWIFTTYYVVKWICPWVPTVPIKELIITAIIGSIISFCAILSLGLLAWKK